MHREGHLDRAITHWKKSLELAELNREFSSLSSLTEILWTLFGLHFQEGKRLKQESENEAEDNPETSLCHDDSSSSTGGVIQLSLSLEEALNDTPSYLHDKQKRQPSSSGDNDAAAHHKREAQQYINRIKPVMVQSQWLRCDLSLMDFLCELKAWELALVVAKKLSERSSSDQRMGEEGEEPDKGLCSEESSVHIIVHPQKFAVLHFHIASLKLKRHKQGEALQHLQVAIRRLEEVSADQRDMTMYLKALQLLAAEYQHQGQSNLALKTYRKQQNHASPEQYAHILSQMAEIYIADGRLDMALEELESAYDQREKSIDAFDDSRNNKPITKCAIRSQLLQLKGDVYCRLGRMDESMQVYQQAFKETQNPAEKAKLLYIMGRLCIRMGRTRNAITCFMHELEITEHELGSHHLSVSVIYHELAKLYDEGLGLHKVAMQNYNKALEIELAVMDDLRSTIASCNKCDAVCSHRACDAHANIHAQVQGQIRETKKCMGRIHFNLGDFDGAMKAGLSSDQL